MANNEPTPAARATDTESDLAEISRLLAQTIQAVKHNNRVMVWQIIIFALVMAGTAIGSSLYFFPFPPR